jgi:hypothetical protein
VGRYNVRGLGHRLAGHADDLAALVGDPDQDQASVQVGHRDGALGDRSLKSTVSSSVPVLATMFLIRPRMTSAAAVQQRLPGGHRLDGRAAQCCGPGRRKPAKCQVHPGTLDASSGRS